MARKVVDEVVNKAEAIRRYREQHPDAMPIEVVAALAKMGIKTDAAYVSTITHVHKIRQQKRVRTVPRDTLVETRAFIDDMGGEKKARAIIDRLDGMGGLAIVREAIDLIAQLTR